ncbi:MAG: metal-dependent hydrolase [Thermodesulfobacteriota bacterium]|nr:metal-dependent hydrolase [Thermodesulfobacteriota bacterium]
MIFSRRQFFKGLAGFIGAVGLQGVFKGDVVYAAEKSPIRDGKVGIEWLGHGSFLFISCKGKKILFDPWISTNPKCPGKYRKEMAFSSVDFILWTHGHVDHFMLSDAKELIAAYNPKVVAPWELSFFIKAQIPKADCQTFTLGNKGATADFDGIKITMVEAFHSAGAQLTGFEGANRFVGEAVGYIMEFENGLKIYHSGDTSLMGDMKTIIGDFYKPDIAILPIGGVFTMGPDEAAFACKMIRPRIVIPEHYSTFPVLVQTSDGFKKQVSKKAPQVKVLDLKPGLRVDV